MIYQYNAQTERMRTFDNVISWEDNNVEWNNGGYRGKIYCDSDVGEYFTDDPEGVRVEQPATEPTLDDALAALDAIGVDTTPPADGTTTEGGVQA